MMCNINNILLNTTAITLNDPTAVSP